MKYVSPKGKREITSTRILHARLENLVRAFLGMQQHKLMWDSQHLLESNDPMQMVSVGLYHAGFQEYTVTARQATACAILGVRAADVLHVLRSMSIPYDGGDVPVVGKDSRQIISNCIAPLEAVYVAVNNVLHGKTQHLIDARIKRATVKKEHS